MGSTTSKLGPYASCNDFNPLPAPDPLPPIMRVSEPTTASGLFTEPPRLWMPPPLAEGARALVLGVGGGCDVFAAHALAQIWAGASPNKATVMCGNCIGPRVLDTGHSQLAPQRSGYETLHAP